MKKLLVIFAALALVWAFAAPAAAVDWNFYGSARMATFWTSSETGDGATKVEDQDLQWDWQGNSRIGARVKGESTSGMFELGLKSADGSDVDVGTRRLEGHWNFGAGTLTIAKSYTATNQFISGQVFASDNGLLGQGFNYAFRPGFIGLTFGGFQIQLIEVEDGDFALPTTAGASSDTDVTIPKIEAKWGMAFDTFNFDIRGGYQHYEIKNVTSPVDGSTNDIDIDSWILGADGNFNFGPVRLGAGVSFSTNGGNAKWTQGAGTFDGDDDVNDTDTWQAGIVAAFKMSDMVSFEGGFGYRVDSFDGSGAPDDTEQWHMYVQSVIGMAPGVYVIPEFGYSDIDADGSSSDSSSWYLGAKWQIDF